MNNSEKNPPYPFGKIAVAVAFSPRVEAILAEAKRLQDIFRSSLCFIHVGKRNLQEETHLKHLFHRFALDAPDNKLIWEEGDPVEHILEVCSTENIDLLVAGALEKESLVKYFMGSVARKLSRKAKCSVMMLREPDIHEKPIRHIVVEGNDHPKTITSVKTAIYIAKQTNANEISIIQEEDASKMALIRSNELSGTEVEELRFKILKEEDAKLAEIINCTDCGNLKLNVMRLAGKPGFEISKYARMHHADLLLLNSPNTKLGFIDRVFPHDIEYTLADLPCDVMIVHGKAEE